MSCYTCGTPGHYSQDFPSRGAIVFSTQSVSLIREAHPLAIDGYLGHWGGFLGT